MKTLIAVAAALLLAPAAPPAFADALLRPSVAVNGDVVRLGDLFDNAGPNANEVVARAPAPGHRAVVDADWLQHVAAMNGLDWKTDDPFLEVTIARNGVSVGREQIVLKLAEALSLQGVPVDAQIQLDQRDLDVMVPVGAPAAIAVRDLYYDDNGKRFSAVIEAPAGAADASRITVSGRVFTTVEVPVMAHAVRHGEVIDASDVTLTKMRAEGVRRDLVMDVDRIVGMVPRQSLRAGQPLTLGDLQRPLAVERGALVTMVLRQGSMELSAQGRALDAGSLGDVIRVANTRSNLTLSARIEGPNLVNVGSDGVAPGAGPVRGVALAN